jgi:hypothetical protein
VHDLAFVYTVGYDTLTSSDTLFYVLYVICAVLGVTGLEFFYCFHLLDLVLMSNALQVRARVCMRVCVCVCV